MKTRDLRKMGRRNYIRSLAGLGVSAAAIPYLTPETLAKLTDNPDEEVPRIKFLKTTNRDEYEDPPYPDKPEREAVFYTIPRDRWGYIEATFAGAHNIEKLIREVDQTTLISAPVKLTPDRYIEVRYPRIWGRDPETGEEILLSQPDVTVDELRDHLPDSVNGSIKESGYQYKRENIPVEIKEVDEVLDTECDEDGGDYYNHYYDDIPGGCQNQISRAFDDEPRCTSCAPAQNSYGEIVLITAGHCTFKWDEGEDPSDGVGRTVGQPLLSSPFGQVQYVVFGDTGESPYPMDAASVGLDERDHKNWLASDDGNNSYQNEISGQVGWDALKDGVVDELWKQGRTTGGCYGDVASLRDAGDDGWYRRAIFLDATSSGGDSGGPYFHIDFEGYAYIAAVHRGRAWDSESWEQHALGPYIGDVEGDLNVWLL